MILVIGRENQITWRQHHVSGSPKGSVFIIILYYFFPSLGERRLGLFSEIRCNWLKCIKPYLISLKVHPIFFSLSLSSLFIAFAWVWNFLTFYRVHYFWFENTLRPMVNIDDWMCSHLSQWPQFMDDFIPNIPKPNAESSSHSSRRTVIKSVFLFPIKDQSQTICFTRALTKWMLSAHCKSLIGKRNQQQKKKEMKQRKKWGKRGKERNTLNTINWVVFPWFFHIKNLPIWFDCESYNQMRTENEIPFAKQIIQSASHKLPSTLRSSEFLFPCTIISRFKLAAIL